MTESKTAVSAAVSPFCVVHIFRLFADVLQYVTQFATTVCLSSSQTMLARLHP